MGHTDSHDEKKAHIDRSASKIEYGLKFSKYLLGNIWYLIKRGKFKEAYKYFLALAFTEEGGRLLDPLFRRFPSLASKPLRIEVETTTVCPLRCLKCEHTYWKRTQRNMSLTEFKSIVDQFPRLSAVSLSGIGHSLNNPEFFEIAKYAKSKGLHVQFFDPFLLINEDVAKKLIDLRINRIWVSMDAATKESYEALQVGSNFDVVTRNIRNLMKLKKEMKSPFPEIDFHFIVTKTNAPEMPQYLDLVNSLVGTQKIVLVQYTTLIPFKENVFLRPEVSPQLLEETKAKAAGYDNFLVYLFNVPPKKLPLDCCSLWTVPFITVDGYIYACCALTEANQRQLVDCISFGNIFEESFESIWNSEKYTNLRNCIVKGITPEFCNRIRPCPIFETAPYVR